MRETKAVAVVAFGPVGPVVGATVTLEGSGDRFSPTNQDGYTIMLAVPAGLTASHLRVTATGFLPFAQHVDLPVNEGDIDLVVAPLASDARPDQLYVGSLVALPPPPPPGPARPSQERVVNIRAGFCNRKDSGGLVEFEPYVTGLPTWRRKEWYGDAVAAGSTHFVLAPGDPGAGYYPGWPPQLCPPKLLQNPRAFRAMVDEVLAVTTLRGESLVPIIMLDEGGKDCRSRIQQYWRPLLDALKDVLDICIIVPGWELIPASDWTSSDMSYALRWLGAYGIPHLWVECGPRRWAISSNPVEDDDPWQGAEADCWKSHGGEFVEGFLYETENVVEGHDDPFCDPAQENWRNRLDDGLVRMLTGFHGWRVMPVCLFETVAWGYYRGKNSERYARQIAEAAKLQAAAYGKTIGYGNGLPLSED